MKRLLTAITVAIGVASATAQTQFTTNAPPVVNNVLDFLSRSNLYVATYGIYDTTSKKPGAGIGLGYKINDFVITTLRFDAVVDPADNKLAVYVPSGSLQLQLPLPAFGFVKVTPLAFAGVATTLNGSNDGDAVGIVGVGAAIGFNIKPTASKLIPKGLIGDWERWTGGGFNNSQIRAGIWWNF